MAPSTIEPAPAAPALDAVAPPRFYAPKEAHFGELIKPRNDGYQEAKRRGVGRTAIVIDNGELLLPLKMS